MDGKPIISVIIPVYNVEIYLCGCLDSLLAQTFSNYEAICVNDGSTDNSLSILESYMAWDKRIKIINQSNQGLSCARNTGMDAARGAYIFFLDSDDYIHPQALEFLYRCAMDNGIELVCAGYKGNPELYKPMSAKLKYENIKQEEYKKPLEAYFKEYKNKLPGMVWTKLYEVGLVSNIRFIERRLYEDEYFTALVMEKCTKLIRLDFDMYNYYYGRNDAITTRADGQVLISHLYNVRFLCKHFSYDKNLLRIIKSGKVKGILFGSCLKAFPFLQQEMRAGLIVKFVEFVRKLVDDGLICYNDFGLIDRYRLYRVLNGHIPIADILRSNRLYRLYRKLRS